MEQKQMFGIIGSILLFIGVFTPIVSAPIIGSINYFSNGRGDGVIILILSIISFILVVNKAYKLLLFSGLGTLAMLIFTFINFEVKLNEITTKMNLELADNPFKGVANTAVNSVQLQWGWALLVIGSILIIGSSKLKSDNNITFVNTDNDETETEFLICPKCNMENEKIAGYCTECGEHLQKDCPKCSSRIPINSNFCANCGVQL